MRWTGRWWPRLTAVAKPVEITGHGPHALPFEQPQTATWREPDGRDQPRTPDLWTFALPGEAEVTLTLADGMVGELRRVGSDAVVTRVVGSWTGTIAAGDYQLSATSLGRNDRLGYTVWDQQPDAAARRAPQCQPARQPAVQPGGRAGGEPDELGHDPGEGGTAGGRRGGRCALWQAGGRLEHCRLTPLARRPIRAGGAVRLAAGHGGHVTAGGRAPPRTIRRAATTAPPSDDSDDAPPSDGQPAQTAATLGGIPAVKSDAQPGQ